MEQAAPKGVKTRLIAVVLIFAGMMDAMLSWRGGFALETSTIVICAAGAALYAIGAVRGGRGKQLRENNR
jgi:hypothetical protein